MKFPSLFSLSALLTASIILGSCSGSGSRKTDNVAIDQLDANFSILSGQRVYLVVTDGDTAYLDRSVSIHWPVTLGDADLSPLREAILAACFTPDSTSAASLKDDTLNPDSPIRRFLLDTADLTSDPTTTVTPVDSIPSVNENYMPRLYFSSVKATILELDEQLITYRVTVSSYMGGAHPMTAVRPITFDLNSSTILTLDNLLSPAGHAEIMPIITSALARQLDVPVSGLRRAGIFTDQLTRPGSPYIYNNTLYFHYNPYDIAPYSTGMIDVALYPYEIDSLLTPSVRPLLNTDF